MEELVSEFKKELKYAVGGKIDYLVSRMSDGGEIDDAETWNPMEDSMDDDMDLDSNPVKPTVKPPKVVSRQQYRMNMYNSRQQHPEWSRWERKTWSMTHTGKPEPINYETDDDLYTDDEEDVVITSPQPAKPATPTLHPSWLERAKRFGFKSIDDVRKWQQANGLVVDGKFGKNSEAKWRSLQRPQGATPAGSSSSYWDARAKSAGFASIDELKQWQAANGLVADGKYGANSEAKMKAIQAKQGDKYRGDMAMANMHADAAQRGGVGRGVLLPMTGDQYALYNQEMARRAQEEANRKKAEEEKRIAEAQARAAEDMYYTQAMFSPYRYMR